MVNFWLSLWAKESHGLRAVNRVIGFYRILLLSFNSTCGLYFLFSHKALIALSILLFSGLNGLALRKIYVILLFC